MNAKNIYNNIIKLKKIIKKKTKAKGVVYSWGYDL